MGNPELQNRILSTYNSLRMGMGAIAVATPVVMVLWGKLFGIDWQDSLSNYYFAPTKGEAIYSVYPVRGLFIGIMWTIGWFLFLYKGFSRREDWALNFAGLFALGVAVFPMYAQSGYLPYSNYVHFTSAVLSFVCMGYVAIFCHDETLRWLQDEKLRTVFRNAYRVIGWFMALCVPIGAIAAFLIDAVHAYVFWIETAGIEAFAAYWITKTIELKTSEAQMKAAIFGP